MNYTVQTGSVDQQIPAPVGFWKAFRFWLKLGFISFGGPLISSRRRATRSVPVGGRAINAEETLSLFWVSANRDEQVFEDAELFRGPDQNKNRLYGAGIHVCPGAPLARLAFRVLMEEVLAGTKDITLTGASPTRAVFPAGGFSQLNIQFQ